MQIAVHWIVWKQRSVENELVKEKGFFTTGVSANGYITPKRGFGTKWDKYRNHIHDGGGLKAERLLAKMWESLAGIETKPWFAYVGFIDTHVSWRAKEPLAQAQLQDIAQFVLRDPVRSAVAHCRAQHQVRGPSSSTRVCTAATSR